MDSDRRATRFRAAQRISAIFFRPEEIFENRRPDRRHQDVAIDVLMLLSQWEHLAPVSRSQPHQLEPAEAFEMDFERGE